MWAGEQENRDYWPYYDTPPGREQRFSPDMEYKIVQTETGDHLFFIHLKY